jgi:hypothetical protein
MQPPETAVEPGTKPARQLSKGSAILLDAFLGVVIFAVLGGLCLVVEQTSLGHAARSVYEATAMRLSNGLNPPPPLARIINIDGFQYGNVISCTVDNQTTPIPTTDRDMLYSILDGISAEGHPYSAAIDIDFGPCANDFVLPNDSKFFDRVLKLERDRFRGGSSRTELGPIFLGSFRGARDDPAYWFVREQYAALAANIAIPEIPGRIVWSVQRENADRTGYGIAERLAFPNAASPPADMSRLAWLRAPDEPLPSDDSRIRVRVAPVDYRALSTIRDRSIAIAPKTAAEAKETISALARAHMFDDEIVVIAVVHRKSDGLYDDSHYVPGFGMQPGPLVHVTAANSLRSSRFYLLAPQWRLVLDIGLSFIIITVVAMVRWRHLNSRRSLKSGRLARFLFAFGALGLIAIALSLLSFAQVMWDDALLLGAFFAIHPLCEVFTMKAARSIRGQSAYFSSVVAYGSASSGEK